MVNLQCRHYYPTQILLDDTSQYKSVLDVGCGFGRWGSYLRGECNYKGYLVGIDIHSETLACENVQRLYDGIYNYDLSKPLPKLRKFDLVICDHVVEHLPKPKGKLLLNRIIVFKNLSAYFFITLFASHQKISRSGLI